MKDVYKRYQNKNQEENKVKEIKNKMKNKEC